MSETAEKFVLLWENASPDSDFAAQTIALDLSGYTFVGVEYMLRPNDAGTHYLINLSCIGKISCFTGMDNVVSGGKLAIYRRYYTVTTAGVEFRGGYWRYYSDTTATSGRNNVLIPQRIYGIKV